MLLLPKYDVYKQEAPSGGSVYWRVMSATHLTPDENVGRHNVYVTAVDDLGQRVRDPNTKIGWSWEGRRDGEDAPLLPLDKRDGEPPGNVPLYSPGMKASVWIEDSVGTPSDRVVNLHTNHPDELGPNGETWNSIGHHSYHIIFQRLGNAIPPPVIPPPDEHAAKTIVISAPDMSVTMVDGASTRGPCTIVITFSPGQEFARG